MINALLLSWGILPLAMGFGFLFRPRLMMRLEKSYARQAQRFQKRFFKAHRATGLFLILVGFVMILSIVYPVWIFNGFLLARLIAGALFPQMFIPTQTAIVIPTVWI